ncbi:ANTAR domain-containing protein [Modestobacter sp. DSM 44400]|uniref:ANTAR domain-containing protein n=1 Tax=Modestobacter sp. DSM 44400 TaxID=1550230 RepID=UPI000898FDA0|nr:ANTAR domain-containing protein [Modestobacter sp. DSM 44400]SDY82209.1 ANTAR domain-containing protein [Modestobacter sp. DSM 44400]
MVSDDAAAELAQSRRELAAVTDQVRQLETALVSSRQIGMAMGILMKRHQLTEEQAFDQLRDVSSRRNVKLRDVAIEVVRGAHGEGGAAPPAVLSTDGT